MALAACLAASGTPSSSSPSGSGSSSSSAGGNESCPRFIAAPSRARRPPPLWPARHSSIVMAPSPLTSSRLKSASTSARSAASPAAASALTSSSRSSLPDLSASTAAKVAAAAASASGSSSACSLSNPAMNSSLDILPSPSVSSALNSTETESCSWPKPSRCITSSAGSISPLLSASMTSKIELARSPIPTEVTVGSAPFRRPCNLSGPRPALVTSVGCALVLRVCCSTQAPSAALCWLHGP